MDSDNLFRNLALIYVEQFNLSRHISEGDWATSFFPFLLIYLFLSYWSVWVPRCGFALSPILPEICIASKISSLRNSLSLFGNVTLKTYLYKLTTLSTILINFYKLWTPSTIIFSLHMKLKATTYFLFFDTVKLKMTFFDLKWKLSLGKLSISKLELFLRKII